MNMPGMDGFETAAIIRQRQLTRDVPIIFITAMDNDTHVSRGYSLGAVDYIQTPVIPEVLRTKVSVFVDLFRKTEQVRQQASWLGQQASRLHQLTAASLAINSALHRADASGRHRHRARGRRREDRAGHAAQRSRGFGFHHAPLAIRGPRC